VARPGATQLVIRRVLPAADHVMDIPVDDCRHLILSSTVL